VTVPGSGTWDEIAAPPDHAVIVPQLRVAPEPVHTDRCASAHEGEEKFV